MATFEMGEVEALKNDIPRKPYSMNTIPGPGKFLPAFSPTHSPQRTGCLAPLLVSCWQGYTWASIWNPRPICVPQRWNPVQHWSVCGARHLFPLVHDDFTTVTMTTQHMSQHEQDIVAPFLVWEWEVANNAINTKHQLHCWGCEEVNGHCHSSCSGSSSSRPVLIGSSCFLHVTDLHEKTNILSMANMLHMHTHIHTHTHIYIYMFASQQVPRNISLFLAWDRDDPPAHREVMEESQSLGHAAYFGLMYK